MSLNRSRTAAVVLAGIVALSAPVLSACGGIAEHAAEQAAEQAIGGDVDVEDGQVTVTDASGNAMAIGENVALPDDWPAEVPAYDNGQLAMVTVQADGSANGMWMTDVTPEEAAAAYEAQLTSAGYTSASTSNLGGMIVAEYEGNGYKVSLQTIAAEGQTSLIVAATKG